MKMRKIKNKNENENEKINANWELLKKSNSLINHDVNVKNISDNKHPKTRKTCTDFDQILTPVNILPPEITPRNFSPRDQSTEEINSKRDYGGQNPDLEITPNDDPNYGFFRNKINELKETIRYRGFEVLKINLILIFIFNCCFSAFINFF